MAAEDVGKAPDEKKMGGPLGPTTEGLGKAPAGKQGTCSTWTALGRTTYPYNPEKAADPLEQSFISKYKDFKEGIPIAKPVDFNQNLKEATKKPCTCLGTLNVDGHGGSWSGGAQEFSPRNTDLGQRSFGVTKDASGTLVPYNFGIFDDIAFCRPCAITLGGCYVAINSPKPQAGAGGITGAGDALAKALTEKTGCSVTAYTDVTTTPKPGEFKGGGKGTWVTTRPKTKTE